MCCILAIALAVAPLLSGCAGGPGGMMGGGYAVAADDACGPQRQALKAYQDYFFASMIQGAAIGAVAGGLTGYLIGNNAQSAAIGAGAGALVGGVGGYYLAKQKANSDPVALTNSVYTDVNKENDEIDGVSLAFRNLRDCRLRTADQVKQDLAAQRITRDVAQARLQRIRQLYLEDVDFAQSLGSKMAERGGEYDNASNQIVQMNPGAQQTLAARERAQPLAGALVANAAARVRATASASGAQVGTIAAGDAVVPLPQGAAPADWTHVQLSDGTSGYVASRLLRPAGTRAPTAAAPPPPRDAAGVAQLTQSNQLKRKALGDQVAEAKTEANGSAFELSGGISRLPPARERAGAA